MSSALLVEAPQRSPYRPSARCCRGYGMGDFTSGCNDYCVFNRIFHVFRDIQAYTYLTYMWNVRDLTMRWLSLLFFLVVIYVDIVIVCICDIAGVGSSPLCYATLYCRHCSWLLPVSPAFVYRRFLLGILSHSTFEGLRYSLRNRSALILYRPCNL